MNQVGRGDADRTASLKLTAPSEGDHTRPGKVALERKGLIQGGGDTKDVVMS